MTVKPLIILIVIIDYYSGFFCFHLVNKGGPFFNIPEQHEQAEVVGKREITKSHDAGGDTGGPTLYFITFKFPDGSVKELRVGVGTSGRKAYDSFHEGDTGILTYKERKDIEKNSKMKTSAGKADSFLALRKTLNMAE